MSDPAIGDDKSKLRWYEIKVKRLEAEIDRLKEKLKSIGMEG